MKLSKTQIRTVVAAIVALAFLGAYATLFMVIKNKNNRISELRNQVDIEIRKDQRLHSIKQLIADLDKDIEQIDTYFVSEDGVVDFLERLESVGSTSGISVGVNSVSVNEGVGNNLPYEFLRVEFVSRGTWRSIVQLISLLETFPLGITVDRMQLERLPNSFYWQMNVSFVVLKLK